MMIDPLAEAHARSVAMDYAMRTATPGEADTDILARAMLYAGWVLEPLRIAAEAAALGEPPTVRLQ